MKSPEETLLDEYLNKINADLKDQRARGRIDMVESGYVAFDEDYLDALRARAELHPHGHFLRPSPRVEQAIRRASELHAGQIRKSPGRKVPYLSHVLSVAEILSRHTGDEATIVAGILHDTIEDTTLSPAALALEFGSEVRDIVLAVSESQDLARDRKASWEERKQSYLINLKAGTDKALLVSSADKIHNLASMVEAYRLAGEDLWQNFNAPPEKKLWFYEEVFKVVSARLASAIVAEFAAALTQARGEFGLAASSA